jgi:Na+/H+ antiporter NhaD/arsenite permease-like protein
MDPQLLVVLAILGVTVILIVTEVFRIDVVAILAMLSLTWVGSITPQQARSGFSSNAVLAIIASWAGVYTSRESPRKSLTSFFKWRGRAAVKSFPPSQ